MAYEILKSIVEAEARAVEIKKQAVAQAEERKADALKAAGNPAGGGKTARGKGNAPSRRKRCSGEPGGNPKDFKGSGGGLFSD